MAKEEETIRGWHFVGETLRDGSAIPKNGVWLPRLTGPIRLCENGYHGSKHPFDALRYAPGDTLCLCEYRGHVAYMSDKFAARQRRIIMRMDASEMLRYFARMQALSVAHLWNPPEVVLDWLMTGDLSLRSAALSAASVTYSAADNAVYSAAFAAAFAAANDAARNAAYNTVNAAYGAAYNNARQEFADLVYECFGLDGDL